MLIDLTGKQLDAYRLRRRLGGGAFGEVYEATDLRRHERVAVKVMKPLKTAQAMQQFLREANALVRLNKHPHIIPIRGFGVDERTGISFIVMEDAAGGSLRGRHPEGAQLPLATIVHYVKQVASALQYAHDDKLIHRDLKPDNVLLGSTGELLLSDFGIATLSPSLLIDLNQPILQNIAGTPYYMAPEQCRGKPEKASDQYALAIMVYEWLCGKPPFTEGNYLNIQYQHIHEPVPPLRDTMPTIDARVEAVVMKALAKDPKERFPSVQAFAEALEVASKAPPPGTPNPTGESITEVVLEVASKAPPPGTRLLLYRGHGNGYSASAWSPDGRFFATGGSTGVIQVWQTSTGTLLLTWEGTLAQVDMVAWSPDGLRLASGSSDSIVQVWEASSGHLLSTYRGHSDSVWVVAWSPDGSRLASGSFDKTVQVWEASSGRLLHTYTGHSSYVRAVAWSPDGSRLASGSSDRTVQVWQAL